MASEDFAEGCSSDHCTALATRFDHYPVAGAWCERCWEREADEATIRKDRVVLRNRVAALVKALKALAKESSMAEHGARPIASRMAEAGRLLNDERLSLDAKQLEEYSNRVNAAVRAARRALEAHRREDR